MTTTNSAKKPPSAGSTRTFNGTNGKIWHKSAPVAVRRAFSAGELADGWAAWQKHLAKRSDPAELTSLTPGKRDPLAWALPEQFESPPWLLTSKDRKTELEKDLLGWLGESAGSAAEAGYALDALACCRAMPRLAAVLSSEVWWALLDHLLATVADADGIELDGDIDGDLDGDGDTPLVHQLLAGELGLTLAYLFPEIAACRRLKSAARAALSAGLADLLDGEGLPHGNLLPSLRSLAACWTRCRAIGEQFKGGCWNKAAGEQYEWLIRQTLRLLRRDGTLAFDAIGAKRLDRNLLAAALRFGGDGDDYEIAKLLLPSAKKSPQRLTGSLRLPKAAMHSSWASVAVLRRDWSRSAERLTAVYPGRSLRVELGCGKDVLFSGEWTFDVRCDGEPATSVGDWDESCWISDHDVDFLELEIELSGGIRLQRQMLFAKQDRFLLLADAVLGSRPGRLEYRSRLPLLPGVSFRAAEESREGFLVGGKRRALVLPLALPEWRADRSLGQLTRTDEGLELHQASEDCRLYAPLFLDLDRRRMTRPVTWRRLTVAESLVVQPDDVAVGYRVSVGRQQWLIYRSLAEPANRTLLGHNLSTEMLVARFERSGEVEPLAEIE